MELNEKLKIFTGRASVQLAGKIAEYLGITLGDMQISSFSDGETYVEINENVRGRDIFLVQSTSPPVDNNLMELLIMIDACRRASAKRITAVIPYYGYARQDKKDKPRVPITAKLVANLITTAGVDRVLTMDLHVDQIQGFFDIKVDHLFATPVIVDYFRKKELENLVILSPDVGGLRRARVYARALQVPLTIVDKRRPLANKAKVINIIGEVKDKQVLIVDDMIDTGGTLLAAVDILKKKGASTIRVACTHPIFSDNAIQKLKESVLKEIVVTDTINLNLGANEGKIKILSVASLLGEAVKRIHQNRSVSSLFAI